MLCAFLFTASCLLQTGPVQSSEGAFPRFENRTVAHGLGSNHVRHVHAEGNHLYVSTKGGLGLSVDRGASFTTRTSKDGLPSTDVTASVVSRGRIIIATDLGLGVSDDGGAGFARLEQGPMQGTVLGLHSDSSQTYLATTRGLALLQGSALAPRMRTMADGLASDMVQSVFANGGRVFVATNEGLSVSSDGAHTFTDSTSDAGLPGKHVCDVWAEGQRTIVATSQGLGISSDGGRTFTIRTVEHGLGSNFVWCVAASGSVVCAGTSGGLSVSFDRGGTFINATTANGLGDSEVRDVCMDGRTVYAATRSGLAITTLPPLPPWSPGCAAAQRVADGLIRQAQDSGSQEARIVAALYKTASDILLRECAGVHEHIEKAIDSLVTSADVLKEGSVRHESHLQYTQARDRYRDLLKALGADCAAVQQGSLPWRVCQKIAYTEQRILATQP